MKKLSFAALACYLFGIALGHADYSTNTITTPGGIYAFSVNGSDPVNPTIQLVAGVTNILIIDTADYHPVVIINSPDPNDWYSGTDSQVVNSGLINVTPPASGFPTVLYYMCYYHGFYGEIDIAPPLSPTPPANTILQVQVGDNIVMTSTGTNTTWLLVPQYSSNLFSGAWSPVPSYTNTFANGTNTTTFPRLDAICGPNVFLRLSQQQN
ncbi:MAG TPA: hypothetical protein VH251_11325 [Verrucomicrobiae bacterium]|nr:hypothetical protein [Verrucomicrobiae bacterium]